MVPHLFIIIFSFFFSGGSHSNVSEVLSCDKISADLKKGKLNGLSPTASMADVKKNLSCFTGESEEGSGFNCGGGVFFLNHDFFFYTGRDYIEIRKNFKGKMSISLLGQPVEEATKNFGDAVRNESHGGVDYYFFKTKYGCLRVNVEYGSITQVGIHAQPPDKVELCL